MLVKNKVTVMVMAIISFLIMPYACNKGLNNLYGIWDTVEGIKSSVMSVMPFNWSTYIADISIETVQQGFNWFLVGIRGLGFATMVYCVSRRAYGYGFIIAALADGMSLINRVVYGYVSIVAIDTINIFLLPLIMAPTIIHINHIANGTARIINSYLSNDHPYP